MRIITRTILLLCLTLCILLPPAPAQAAARTVSVMSVRERRAVSPERFLRQVASSDVTFVGERHDVEDHKRFLLLIMKSLKQRRTDFALGLEMFQAASQPVLDAWVAGSMTEESFKRAYAQNWNYPYELYRDVFLYARQEGIALVGLNIPSSIVQKVSGQGFSALSKEELAQLPVGITCNVDESYRTFIRRVQSVYSRHGQDFNSFCEAQLTWDRSMGYYIEKHLSTHDGRKMLVLTGIIHAWRPGIARQLEADTDRTSTVVIPLAEKSMLRNISPDLMDFLISRD